MSAGELADRHLRAGAGVEQLADHGRRRRLAQVEERLGGVADVGEVAGRVERAELELAGTGRELDDDRRDDGAGRLARAEGVERPQRHHGRAEAQVVGLGELVRGDLGGRVRRLGLQRVRLADRDRARGAVGLAGRGVHQPGGAAGPHRLEHVQGADHVGVHERPRRAVGVGNRSERGQVVHDRGALDHLAHRGRVAHVAEHHVDLVQDVGGQHVQPAARAEQVVQHHGPHPVPAAHQRLDQVGADETLGPRDGNFVPHGSSSPPDVTGR